jgi:arabinose-5-phosphate isomerase
MASTKSVSKSAAEKVVDMLNLESDAIRAAAGRLDAVQVESAVRLIVECGGKVVVTGVGKSGVIGEKIAQTMTSTGTMAVFLHPTDAMHGGLGVIGKNDVVIALSNSGETDEILALLPTLGSRDVEIIAIVGNLNSSLGRRADVVLDASVDKEACPLNLAPTCSTTVALAVGDAIAMAVMEAKGLTDADFAANHPAGRLGKRLTLTVKELMHESPNISADSHWLDVVKAISSHALGAVNVIDAEGRLLGIVTDGDLRRTIEKTSTESLSSINASAMMTADPISTTPNTLAYDALRLMEERESQISVLPVVDDTNQCVGLLRVHDIVRSGL